MSPIIRDQGPKFSLGFGISPSAVPIATDADGTLREGPNPQGSFISKALNNHPVMRFFAVTAASMVGMHVASKFTRGAGVKLLEGLKSGVAREAEAGIQKSWRTTLLHDYRSIQKTMDLWEGRVRVPVDPGDLAKGGVEQAGFWQTYSEAEEAALRRHNGEFAQHPADWTMRDEIQQRLVRQARRLPYELPAIYAAQRGLVDPMLQPQERKDAPKWYNPVDVLGDFAQQSVKNVAFMLAPWEAGQGAVSQGWRRMMTYGDVAMQGPYKQSIRDFSIGMQTVLNLVGHDVSNVMFNTIQKSNQSLGAFSAGLHQAMQDSKPLKKRGNELAQSFKDMRKQGAYNYLSRNFGAFTQNLSPKGSGFIRGARDEWRTQEWYYRNLRAARTPGETHLNYAFDEAGRRTLDPRQKIRREFIRGGGSEIEEIAGIIQGYTRGGPDSDSFNFGRFHNMRRGAEYKKLLSSELERRGVDPAAARRFKNHVSVPQMPGIDAEGKLRVHDISERVHFGDKRILQDTRGVYPTDWHRELQARLEAIVGPEQNLKIAQNITDSVKSADTRFTDPEFRRSMRTRIKNEWSEIYHQDIVPYTKSRLGESRLPFEMFSGHMDGQAEEWLVRKTASSLGIPVEDQGHRIATGDLRRELVRHGFSRPTQVGEAIENVWDPRRARAFLMDKGAIAKPWQDRGFNILGLRPLSVREALRRKYFRHDVVPDVHNLVQDLDKTEPLSDIINRPVGRGVYETSSGQILDLSQVRQSGRRFADFFANNFQIPLIHVRPLNLFAYQAMRDRATSPIIQIQSGMAELGFLGDEAHEFNTTVWMRHHKGKGHLVGHNLGERHQFEGLYATNPTDKSSFLGRHARLGFGNTGRYAPPIDKEAEGFKDKLRRIFKVDPDQPQSLFRFIDRIRRGESGYKTAVGEHIRSAEYDYSNPSSWINWLFDTIRGGGLPKDLAVPQAEGYENTELMMRRFGLTREAAKGLENRAGANRLFHMMAGKEPGPDLLDMLTVSDPALETEVAGKLQPHRVPLSGVRRGDDLLRLTTSQLDRDRDMIEGWRLSDPAKAEALGPRLLQAQGALRKGYLEDVSANRRALDESAAQAMRSTGIHRRVDEMRAEFYRYLMARQGILEGGGQNVIQDLLSELDELRIHDVLSSSKFTEARAAVLSLQLNFLNLQTYAPGQTRIRQIRQILGGLGPEAHGALEDVRSYTTSVLHHGNITDSPAGAGPLRRAWDVVTQGRGRARRKWGQTFGRADYEFPGFEYNPFGAERTYVPTFGNVYRNRGKLGAIRNVLGENTWNDPKYYNTSSFAVSHLYQRLNRYLSTFGMGLEESAFRGPQDFLVRGLIGRRVLPGVAAATTLMAADRTIGGFVRGKDDYGQRQYTPAVTGALATGLAGLNVGLAGLLPGGENFQQKKEEMFGNREVPVRKGRWWPLGNQPWKGGRIQYFRPSWYRRFMAGTAYTGQNWDSPMERLAFGYDFSPLRYVGGQYHWEKKHANDRPYPVTGDMFTGPWGPVTGMLNLTAGRILKPHRMMHKKELNAALSGYQQVGMYGMAPPTDVAVRPGVVTRMPTGGAAYLVPRTAGDVLGVTGPGGYPAGAGGGDFTAAYRQPYGFMPMPYGTDPNTAISSYGQGRPVNMSAMAGDAVSGGMATGGLMMEAGDTTGAGSRMDRRRTAVRSTGNALAAGRWQGGGRTGTASGISQGALSSMNAYYSSRAGDRRGGYSPYNRTVLTNPKGFPARVLPAANPIKPGKFGLQLGEYGYQSQELFGIYGFLFGSARQSLGMGRQDFTPKRPVYQSAGRGYGSERSFWDLNLGGLGDFPNLSEGEYGNMEVSEIARRFIPHRRRDVHEVNPIPNDMGKMYPWLPGNDYFLNFRQGDPYIAVPEGEMRLPGAGYERLHQLHSDATGKYGLVDQHSILGDVAPWSMQYKAIDKVLRKMNLTPEDEEAALETRKQVAAVNKRIEFHPYQYAGADFQTKSAKVVGFQPGNADVIETDQGPIRLAGVRARSGEKAQRYIQSLLQPGDEINLKYDANRPPDRDAPMDAVITKGNTNVNRLLLHSDFGYESKRERPLDYNINRNRIGTAFRALGEQIAHRNTMFNMKFLPYRTAAEDWERTNVYGSSFPQWQHPVRDFLKPIAYRATNRNPLVSAGVLAAAGGMFGVTPESKAAGRLIGGGLGFTLGLSTDVESVQTGTRFVPKNRKREMAVEENTDILNYVKYSHLYSQARQQAMADEGRDPESYARQVEQSDYKKFQFTNIGPETSQALQYRKQMLSTMYGADVYGDVMSISAAIPKRKRDHFMEFLSAPINERQRILSTAPRLERRILEARWGMKVEKRPDLVQYFSEHELPGPGWEGWNPNVGTDTVKIKLAQSAGLDASQMGYFPQQIEEANLINVSYPDFRQQGDPHAVAGQLQQMLYNQGLAGDVQVRRSAFPGNRVQLSAGVN